MELRGLTLCRGEKLYQWLSANIAGGETNPRMKHALSLMNQLPARRWVVERTLGWLAKRRSIKIRWYKNSANWMAFLKLACAPILLQLIFG